MFLMAKGPNVSMELSTARIHGAKTKTLKTWNAIFFMYNLF